MCACQWTVSSVLCRHFGRRSVQSRSSSCVECIGINVVSEMWMLHDATRNYESLNDCFKLD
jgi:hypothetical protein